MKLAQLTDEERETLKNIVASRQRAVPKRYLKGAERLKLCRDAIGGLSYRELATKYGVSEDHVRKTLSLGVRWGFRE